MVTRHKADELQPHFQELQDGNMSEKKTTMRRQLTVVESDNDSDKKYTLDTRYTSKPTALTEFNCYAS